ncbi:hypothetical protein G9A89_004496 [Geosiphon pyriformis]|nr:hypothetical protein G9A89_004496 [Geosiphon pyriformis]
MANLLNETSNYLHVLPEYSRPPFSLITVEKVMKNAIKKLNETGRVTKIPNAFLIYKMDLRNFLIESTMDNNMRHLAQNAANHWKKEPEHVKSYYENISKEARNSFEKIWKKFHTLQRLKFYPLSSVNFNSNVDEEERIHLISLYLAPTPFLSNFNSMVKSIEPDSIISQNFYNNEHYEPENSWFHLESRVESLEKIVKNILNQESFEFDQNIPITIKERVYLLELTISRLLVNFHSFN